MAASSPHNVRRPLPDCYRTAIGGLQDKVGDFDDKATIDAFEACARSSSARNFLVDIGEAQAWCTSDLSQEVWEYLLDKADDRRPGMAGTRWIQVWGAHTQQPLITLLAKKYGLSPRLAALMFTEPKPDIVKRGQEEKKTQHRHSHNVKSPRMNASMSDDEEKMPRRSKQMARNESLTIDEEEHVLNTLNHHDIASAIWHWSSVDIGKRYICLGYNTLHNVAPQMSPSSDYPAGTRIWNWLILTDDETVILISDRGPPPGSSSPPFDASYTRRNLLNTIHQLSRANERQSINSVSLVPIRALMKEPDILTSAAGLLFFYLFDDWLSTYSLLTMPERRFSEKLNSLRRKMMATADISHVEDLHHLGRQLATLKLLYQSYETLIERVLERHKGNSRNETLAVVDTSQVASNIGTHYTQALNSSAPGASTLLRLDSSNVATACGTYLNPAATDRFERLNHRIRLYVLTEIDESIRLKDQLLSMVSTVQATPVHSRC